ncbi:hypothetical protein PHMEG_00035639 [Phytophthora megakarya]|uniref:Uncharacterized protein n=1 Tax=Phytophthora megakarya TaxID=4795 RepID=A0A225UNK1_9STRA|nr:hypothetical protein PHMEG_00035639 [Phytophthora megakarya]
MKVLRDPEVSKLGAALKKNPSMVNQPSIKKQIRGIAVKNVGKGGGVSTGDKIEAVMSIISMVLVALVIVGIPIGTLVGVIAVAAT